MEILGGISALCFIVGLASICGAIEFELQMRYPVAMIILGLIAGAIYYYFCGGMVEYEDWENEDEEQC